MHDINPVDGATLAGLAAIILKDGWRWFRGNGTVQMARLEERIKFIHDRLERIEGKVDKLG